MNSVIEKITPLIAPVVQGQGLELFDVEYAKEGDTWYLRVYIDKEQGVDLDDCTRISLALSSVLDEKDLIPQSYLLEVSSPGLERPLKTQQDYLKYQGQLISVETSREIEGFTKFTGFLAGTDDQGVQLTYEKNQISIPWSAIDKAHLTVEF
ncbi:MAG: ribosome maturation factor RimP [Peptococcaceae bacterium]|nr:ribosome maturation factor RimP [Peptococcaceae bacterium]MDR2736894.1 ribosome maturation factor RimP [Gracilibacteraceae bacterium]